MIRKLYLKLSALAFLMTFAGTGFAQINSFPHLETFDSFPLCPKFCQDPCQTLLNGWINDPTGDDLDWTTANTPPTSSNTGPNFDHTTGVSGQGNFMYTETSSGCSNSSAYLLTPQVDLSAVTGGMVMEFWYHMFGTSMGTMHIDQRTWTNGAWGAWNNDIITSFTDNQNLWQQQAVDLTSYAGDTIQIRFRAETGTSFGSDMAIDDVNFFQLFPLDAGVASIDGPPNPITPGSLPVTATIINWGSDTLVSASVGWMVNGAMQTPLPWTGSLAYTDTDGPLTLGNFTFPTGFSTITAWTTLPNGGTDQQNSNDTMRYTVCTPFNGVFTVGMGGDFADFDEVSDALNVCGIDGPVTFNVMPGTYNTAIDLGRVPGNNATNTITFDGGNAANATIAVSGRGNVMLRGTDYVTVKNLTLTNAGTDDAYGVFLSDTADHVTIDSCIIEMTIQANIFDCHSILASADILNDFAEGNNANWLTVSNCDLSGGDMGIHIEGGTTGNFTRHYTFTNNNIHDVDDYGFYMDEIDSVTVQGNTVRTVSAFGDGVYFFDVNNFYIEENNIAVSDWGIYVTDGNDGFATTVNSRVNNNMVTSTTDYAIYLNDIESTDVFHNSTWGLPGLAVNDEINLDIRNNVFVSSTDFAFESFDGTPIASLDYNVYYTNGPNVARWGGINYATVALWQAGQAANNANSVEGDPVYANVGAGDLHLVGIAANDMGDNTVGITVDIDGDTRPQAPSTVVDAGADEYTPLSRNAVFVDLINPPSLACGDSNQVVTVVIRNLGLDTINAGLPLAINVDATGDIVQNFPFSYTGPLGFNESDTVDIGTMNTYAGGVVDFDGYVTLAGEQDASNDTLVPTRTSEFIPFVPVGLDGYGCGLDSAYIYGQPWTGVSYFWYASPTDTVPLANADSFLVPSITGQSTYYLEYANNADSLVTTYQGGNGCGGGNMFDLTANNSVNLNAVSVSTSAAVGSTINVTVHYIIGGTFAGNETNASAWATHGTFTATSAGTTNRTFVDFNGNDLPIPAGATYAMYIEFPATYTTGSFPAANADLSFSPGVGLCSSFGGTNNPRTFNGTLYYGTTACSSQRVAVTAVTGVPVTVNLGGDQQLCANDVTLDAGNAGSTFAWSNGSTSQTTLIDTSGTYYVDVMDANGCMGSDSATITLFAPISTDLGNDTLLCDGASLTLDAGNAGATYAWSSGGTAQTESVSTPGDVSVLVTDGNGCTASDTINITTGATPAGSFTFAVTGAGLTYDFTDATTGTPTTWSWDFGDGSGTSTQQNPSYTYAADGNYTVTLTVTNACGTNTFTDMVTVLGLENQLLGGTVSLFPNPNNGRFSVQFSDITAENVQIDVLNLYGQRVFAKELNRIAGSSIEQFDLSSLAKGVYHVKVSAEGQSAVYKVVVE